MFQEIKLNCGRTQESEPLVLKGEPGVTIFVGPNNSGKSALLEALFNSLIGKPINKPCAFEDASFPAYKIEMLEEIDEFSSMDKTKKLKLGDIDTTIEQWLQLLENKKQWKGPFGGAFRSVFCVWMNGSTRLNMLGQENNPNLIKPQSPIAKFFSDDDLREEFQRTVFDGIGYFPVIDRLSSYGHLKLAFSTKKPKPSVERGADETLTKFLKDTTSREMVSDGFNAYVGMIGSLFSKKLKAILVDEPEAFLHPALARTLGKQIALQAKEKQVYIASHSSEFLIGAIESGIPVRIVRLQYQNNLATVCLLDGNELKAFMQDPLFTFIQCPVWTVREVCGGW